MADDDQNQLNNTPVIPSEEGIQDNGSSIMGTMRPEVIGVEDDTNPESAVATETEEADTETAEEEPATEGENTVTANDQQAVTSGDSAAVSEPEEEIASEQAPRNDDSTSDEQLEASSENNDLTPEELTPDMVGDNQAAVDSLLDNTNDNPDAKWFVVHTYSGHENKVATALKQRVEAEHLENRILDVIVPTQDKIEIRSGKKATVKEKIFPGYILVKMLLDDNSWLAVRTTQGVTGFVGIGNKPTPIPASEVNTIVRFMTQGAAPTFKDVFMVDDTVKIVDGPFSEFIGKVDSVDKEHGKVRVLVSIFGRETPVELDFLQVQKL